MATTETAAEPLTRNRVAIYALLGIVAVAVAAIVMFLINRPPQMGADEDVFLTVDALYTAVRMKDETKVNQCAERLSAYREAGKLPASSAGYLDRVIANSRAGQWDSAAEQLYTFMLAQRREGADTVSPEKRLKPPTAKKQLHR